MQSPEQVIKQKDILSIEPLNEFIDNGLLLWEKNEKNFNIHLFTIACTEEVLKEIWSDLTEKIAFHFQTTLNKEIELWNIYIVFFVAKTISTELKYTIEHDHYCARKIVMDNLNLDGDISSDIIEKTIYTKLFDLNIQPLDKDEYSLKQLETIIRTKNPKLANLEFINQMIEEFKGSTNE